jgi:hypothetical protein
MTSGHCDIHMPYREGACGFPLGLSLEAIQHEDSEMLRPYRVVGERHLHHRPLVYRRDVYVAASYRRTGATIAVSDYRTC